ncbi:hypothetical protein C1H46_013182 [Malus baccata]|uniref:PCI domain-containing protein n=1 Tax=Malus baccata TaxID=106549 RepID=A0A540MQT6_MALBA|nr:hypothetical protein C1H46_013182 [Malus baccata]
MEIEQKQEEVIDHYVKQASSLDGSALGPLVAEVTSHPALFAFSDIIAVPNVLQELDVINVRELEDFLINECMYAGIIRGKLDQLRKCFEVQFAGGRDLRPGQLGSMIQTLSNWLDTSSNLLISIQEKMK